MVILRLWLWFHLLEAAVALGGTLGTQHDQLLRRGRRQRLGRQRIRRQAHIQQVAGGGRRTRHQGRSNAQAPVGAKEAAGRTNVAVVHSQAQPTAKAVVCQCFSEA